MKETPSPFSVPSNSRRGRERRSEKKAEGEIAQSHSFKKNARERAHGEESSRSLSFSAVVLILLL